jgi:signal transduction histidine kinase
MSTYTPHDVPRFLTASGEMGARIWAHDWAGTPLGPIAAWPYSLKTVISLMLNSPQPMWMGWGEQVTFLYNDAYINVLSLAKHPWALGRPTAEVWAEIWDFCGPLVERVFTHGEVTMNDGVRLFMRRADFLEECFYAFSYSPVRDESGNVAGLFCANLDVTSRYLNARRLNTVSDMGTRALQEKTVQRACAMALAAIGENPDDLPFAQLYLAGAGDAAPAQLLQATHPEMDDARALFAVDAVIAGAAPRAVALDNAALRGLPQGLAHQPLQQALVLPLLDSTPGSAIGALVLGVSSARRLDADYRSFLELVATQTANAIRQARAAEEERMRADMLAELDSAKTQFFSNVSHEFRTPLTLLLGPVNDALQDGSAPLPPVQRERLQLMQRNALRLQKLVNTLLEFSRVQAGRAQACFAAVDLAGLTAGLASSFRSAIEGAGMRLEVDCPTLDAQVYVDPVMWEKIVLNLVSNAFKFTFEGGIQVRQGIAGGQLRLEVADTGTGIPSDQLPLLFERFHRVEGARARTHEGSGIGLALVHDLVLLHGGRIEVESVVGRGTMFSVTLPLGSAHLPPAQLGTPAPPLASTVAAYVAEAQGWAQPDGAAHGGDEVEAAPGVASTLHGRLLIADDNADMRCYLQRLLQPQWQVEVCTNGVEALAAVERHPPDMIVSDVMMPQLDGFGLLAALRASPATRDIPFMLLSARAGEEARLEGLRAGADEYLVKPFSGRELAARIEVLRLRHRMRMVECAARRSAESANRAKDEFLAMLGHELRNPLAPIVTALQLMRLRGSDVVMKERDIIERQTRHLVAMVDDLLDVSRVAEGKVQLQRKPVEMAEVVMRAIETASPLIEQRRHQLALDVAPSGLAVLADPVRLAQVLSNLLTNAAKYTEPEGQLAVRAWRDGEKVVVEVEDNGIGIAAEMLGVVFERFTQERQALSRSQGGLGLGLAIARSMMELHGGSVEAHSGGIGCGSTFTVRMPLLQQAAHHAAGVTPPQCDTAPGGLAIMVVDDNEDAARALGEGLELLGHKVKVVFSAPDALVLAPQFCPDVSVLDIGLPGMDGYELATRLRELDGARSMRLFAVTGYGQDADRQQAMNAGFEQHLTKPIDLTRLINLLQ